MAPAAYRPPPEAPPFRMRLARTTSLAKARAAAEACVSVGKRRSDSATAVSVSSSSTQVQRCRPVDWILKCMSISRTQAEREDAPPKALSC
jgi:hypothetical protein